MSDSNSAATQAAAEAEFVVRGSRFAIPALVIVWVVLLPVVLYCFSGPYSGLDFSDLWRIFILPTLVLVWLIFKTRARFYAEVFQVEKFVIHYANVVGIKRGWFLLSIRYKRPDDTRKRPRVAKLSLYEMSRADRKRRLEIIRSRIPAGATVDI